MFLKLSKALTLFPVLTSIYIFHVNSLAAPPPIVYTIAGSDSGGGAGIQADLHAIHSMGCHGCSAITALTAQNSVGVTSIHTPPSEFLEKQLDTLWDDLPACAVKIGMLGCTETAVTVGNFLQRVKTSAKGSPFVVLDPVMISTSGHKLIDDETKNAMIEHVFPFADLITPNKFEAEELLGRKLDSFEDVEQGAKEILEMGVKAVLIKGGHTPSDDDDGDNESAFQSFAQDYFLSSSIKGETIERVCDGARGVWLRSPRYDTENTHGTGCTLSSSIASAFALGHLERERDDGVGATKAIQALDACVLGKAYVTAGVQNSVQLGKGPGPVTHTQFPSSYNNFPSIVTDPSKVLPSTSSSTFHSLTSINSNNAQNTEKSSYLASILPVVDSIEWLKQLCTVPSITDIQLRIKNEQNPQKITKMLQEAQDVCQKHNKRLWINDFWEAALAANCFGVHLGQEDLLSCIQSDGLERLRSANVALGISTHSYAELAVALGVHKPSYISLGPIFGTKSKNVAFSPQGVKTIRKWRELIPLDIPLVVIGGIGNDLDVIRDVKDAGADCIAVIGALKDVENAEMVAQEIVSAME